MLTADKTLYGAFSAVLPLQLIHHNVWHNFPLTISAKTTPKWCDEGNTLEFSIISTLMNGPWPNIKSRCAGEVKLEGPKTLADATNMNCRKIMTIFRLLWFPRQTQENQMIMDDRFLFNNKRYQSFQDRFWMFSYTGITVSRRFRTQGILRNLRNHKTHLCCKTTKSDSCANSNAAFATR